MPSGVPPLPEHARATRPFHEAEIMWEDRRRRGDEDFDPYKGDSSFLWHIVFRSEDDWEEDLAVHTYRGWPL